MTANDQDIVQRLYSICEPLRIAACEAASLIETLRAERDAIKARADRLSGACLTLIRCADECERRVPLGTTIVRRVLADYAETKKAVIAITKETP